MCKLTFVFALHLVVLRSHHHHHLQCKKGNFLHSCFIMMHIPTFLFVLFCENQTFCKPSCETHLKTNLFFSQLLLDYFVHNFSFIFALNCFFINSLSPLLIVQKSMSFFLHVFLFRDAHSICNFVLKKPNFIAR